MNHTWKQGEAKGAWQRVAMGEDPREVAASIGVGLNALCLAMRRCGSDMTTARKANTRLKWLSAANKVREGMDIRAASAMYGVSHTKVSENCTALGIPIPVLAKKALSREKLDREVYLMRQGGTPTKEIAAIYGTSRAMISKRMNRYKRWLERR